MPRKKVSLWASFALLSRIFLVLMFLIPFNGLLPEDQCANFLDFWIPWEKVMKRSGVKFQNFSHKGCKIAEAKIFLRIFFCSLRLIVFLPPLLEVQYPNFLDLKNPWGKGLERNGLIFETFAHKWYKIAAQFVFCFFGEFCLTSKIFCIGATVRIGRELLCLPYAGLFLYLCSS